MTLREHCNQTERHAHDILDRVKAGLPVEARLIRWALQVLGDSAGE